MVSNSSTFQQDLDGFGHEAKKLGQQVGLIAEDVIPGDPATAAEIGEHLSKLGGAFERAGQGIKAIDSGGWTGQAGDAFRQNYLEKAPADWLKAADAFNDAGNAVLDYQKVLASEKEKATRAKDELDRANEASRAAADKHDAAVEAGTAPGDFVDPGADARARAKEQIAAAKAAVQEAGDRAAKVVMSAIEAAPAHPGMLAQIGANLVDGAQFAGDLLYDFGSGAVDGVVGIGTGLWGLGQAYFYSQPAAWAIDPEGKANFDKAASTTAMSVVENPYQAVKSIVDVDAWKQNPAKALGQMAPDAVASAFGGAGVATRAANISGKVGDKVGDLGKTSDTAKTADNLGDASHHTPQPPAPEPPSTPWGDYGSLPPERPAGWHDGPQSTPYGNFDPEPEKPFGPQGSAPEPAVPEPEYRSTPITRTNTWDDWDPVADQISGNQSSHDLGGPSTDAARDLGDHPDGHGDALEQHRLAPESPNPLDDPKYADWAEDGPDYTRDPDFETNDADHQAYREQYPISQYDQRWLESIRTDHPEFAHMPDENLLATNRYTGIEHQQWNEALRNGDTAEMVKYDPALRNLSAALNHMPDHQGTVYRGFDLPANELPGFLDRYQVGEVVEERAFTSADVKHPMPGNIQLIIDSRFGTDISPLSPPGTNFHEVMFNSGSRFQVMERVDLGNGNWQIYLHDLGRR
jgi:hypothetical protein